jgi:hypothetical protein
MSATLTVVATTAAKAIAAKLAAKATKWFHYEWCHKLIERWRRERAERKARMNKTLAVMLALGMAVTMSGCMALKGAAIAVHDAIDEYLGEQTNTTSEASGTATNASGGTAEAPATNTTAYAKPVSVSVDWTARTITPTGMPAGEIGAMLLIGRMADGRAGALDYPVWDAAAGLWRTSMLTPAPGQEITAELHAGDKSAPVIFKQQL